MSIFRPLYRALPAKTSARANQLLLRHANEQQQNGTAPHLNNNLLSHYSASKTNIYSTNRLLHGSSFFNAVEANDQSPLHSSNDPESASAAALGGDGSSHTAQLINQYLPIVSALVKCNDFDGLMHLVRNFSIGYPPLTTADKHIFLTLILDELIAHHVSLDQTESIHKLLLEEFHIHSNSASHLKLAQFSLNCNNLDRAFHWYMVDATLTRFARPTEWENFYVEFIRKSSHDGQKLKIIYEALASLQLPVPADILSHALDAAMKTDDIEFVWSIVNHSSQHKGFLPKSFTSNVASQLLKNYEFLEACGKIQQLHKGKRGNHTNITTWKILSDMVKQISTPSDFVNCVVNLNIENAPDSVHRNIANSFLYHHKSYSLDQISQALNSSQQQSTYFFNILKMMVRSHIDHYAVVDVLNNIHQLGLKVDTSIQIIIDQLIHHIIIHPKMSAKEKDQIRGEIEKVFHKIIDCSEQERNIRFNLYLMNRKVLMQSSALSCLNLIREILDQGLHPSAPAISHTLSKLLAENMYDQGIRLLDEVRPILYQIKDKIGWMLACAPSYSFAIRHHCRRGHHQEASELLKELIEQDIFMDSYASAEFIIMVRRLQNPAQAAQIGFEFFNKLKHHHIKIQTYFINVLLNTCIESDQLNKVWQVQRKISGLQLEVDLVGYGTFIKAALKQNDYNKAKGFFQKVLDSPNLKRDMISRPSIFHQLIEHSIEVNRDFNETSNLFQMMNNFKLPSDERTQALQFRFYTQLEPYQLDKINPLIQNIRDSGSFVSWTHYRILILNLSRIHGELDWAYDLFLQLSKSPLQIHLDLCHAFIHELSINGRHELAAEVYRIYTSTYPKVDHLTLDQMQQAPVTYVNTHAITNPPK
jgi:pentatricopeptide repeat protein